MPPKKKTAASKARSKKQDAPSTPSKSTRATGRAAPETVTTKSGKEYDTTAAASRPTRAAAQADLSFPDTAPAFTRKTAGSSTVKSTGIKRSAPATVDEPPRKRGRPAKVVASSPAKRGPGRPAKAVASPAKRGRGRPAKSTTVFKPASTAPAASAKRGPGRPRKATTAATPKAASKATPAPKPTASSKKRGRQAKETVQDEPPKKRGRPSKLSALSDAVPPEDEQPTPKKRGQPPYGGETTKIDSDDEAAAEQLEEELMDEADDEVPAKRNRGRPPGKGKGKQAAAAAATSAVVEDDGQHFWLMKAEQDGHEEKLANGETFNTKFTIDDLRAKNMPEPWDGVRNPTAAKNMRAMKAGDLAFFYASGGKMPGIVGIMEIVGEAEPDVTASDKNSYGYVEDEKKRSRWCVVLVEFRKKFKKPISRKQLMEARDAGPLANMQEFTAARLSVSKVTKDEWDYIGSLIEGFDDNKDEDGTEEPYTNGNEDDVAMEQDFDLPTLPGVAPTAIMSVEEELPTTDSIFPPVDVVETSVPVAAVSSRPTSRGSRAGSAPRTLAPKSAGSSRAGSRARSKTPQPPTQSALMEAIGEE